MSMLVAEWASAQSTPSAQSTTSPGDVRRAAFESALANVERSREAVIAEIVGRWRETMDAKVDAVGWDKELTTFLRAASAEKVAAASLAKSYTEVGEALFGRWRGPDVIALEEGELIPQVIGSPTDDLVFTPVTPCRIIDTRFATGGLAGRIGPNTGKQFQVNLTDFSAQGGFAGSCGIPTTLDVAGVAINVTSTDQTGFGDLRVIETGGGVPNASLVNYQPGVNIANAAVSRSAIGFSNDIFIYSAASSTHVVVDLMGYFTEPVATALQCTQPTDNFSMPDGYNAYSQSPACAAGYSLTGGGYQWTGTFNGTMRVYKSGPNNAGTAWECGINNASGQTQGGSCYARCCRIPGR
jgi:hypothetical protein